jgi:hypothetical protein
VKNKSTDQKKNASNLLACGTRRSAACVRPLGRFVYSHIELSSSRSRSSKTRFFNRCGSLKLFRLEDTTTVPELFPVSSLLREELLKSFLGKSLSQRKARITRQTSRISVFVG